MSGGMDGERGNWISRIKRKREYQGFPELKGGEKKILNVSETFKVIF